MAVVSSCGRTTRGRSSPLSAHLQAGKGRSLTLEHAHRTAAAMAQICLKLDVPKKRQRSSRTRKTATTHYRASPHANQGLSSHSLSQKEPNFHTPLMTAMRPRVLDLFHLKDSVSLHSRGTGQTPVDKIHSSSPQYESVQGLLGRRSISLTRQQTRRN